MSAIDEVKAERQRQIEEEGWDATHDLVYQPGELAAHGAAYAMHMARFGNQLADDYENAPAPAGWTWGRKWWKPKSPRRDLVRAAALIVAEIDRMDNV